MKMSVIELMKSDYPAITPEAAGIEALRLACEIVKAPPAKEFSFMSGSMGTLVFLCGALRYQRESGISLHALPYIEKVLKSLEASLTDGVQNDLSLASGLCGSIHALHLLNCIGSPRETLSLYALAIDRLSAASPVDPGYTDYYLGTAGRISVLSEIIEDAERFPYALLDAPRCSALREMLLAAMEQLCSKQCIHTDGELLWDLIYTQKPISGLGHGMFGIGAALLGGADVLEQVSGLASKDQIERFRRAGWDALRFERNTYRPDLTDWPDLRPNASPSASLHGICSGAPGIGMGLLGLHDALRIKESRELLKLTHNSCLRAPLRKRDHLCCGKASLAEYFLTRYALTGEGKDYDTAGRILSYMNSERLHCGLGSYTFPAAVGAGDTSLFFGSAGIGYEYLRYAFPVLPPVLPWHSCLALTRQTERQTGDA